MAFRLRFDPQTVRKFQRFRSIRRGYWSFLLLIGTIVLSLGAELLVSNRPLFVKYEGKVYFPTYGSIIPGKVFGFDYDYETNYRDLKKRMRDNKEKGSVVLPVIPYNPLENDLKEGTYPPYPPSKRDKHFLGTDTSGRDVFARLIYGFRTSIFFALLIVLGEYLVGVTVGCLMGYLGGKFDMVLQRLIEIWSNVPFLYVVIIVSSIMVPSFWSLIGIILIFGWINMTWYLRTVAYKEKARDYVLAARCMGMSKWRIVFHEILPNAISVIVTFVPFSVSGGIVALTTLDFLGFGLPAPTPSWGELLNQGMANLHAKWIVSSVVVAMILVLTMVTFIGEAVREAFDPKRFTVYE